MGWKTKYRFLIGVENGGRETPLKGIQGFCAGHHLLPPEGCNCVM